MDNEPTEEEIMVTIYEETRNETARVSSRPLTMIVINWPDARTHRANDPETELPAQAGLHMDEEPTWEDAAWV
jgi:hypothetical protein